MILINFVYTRRVKNKLLLIIEIDFRSLIKYLQDNLEQMV